MTAPRLSSARSIFGRQGSQRYASVVFEDLDPSNWSFLRHHSAQMSSNVGLTTPRGSGTSGYVQRNLSHFKPRDNFAPYPKDFDSLKHRQRKPDKDILDHDRLREIEVKVFDLRDKLEDEGVDEEEIEQQTDALRKKLLSGSGNTPKSDRKGQLKPHQVHELAAAKIEESEKLRKALGISKNYEEGSHWNKQEERLRGGLDDKR